MSNKIFVIDTSVILHDHNVVMHFKDQYVAIQITYLKELNLGKYGLQGWTLEEIENNCHLSKGYGIEINGVKYSSKKQACDELNLTYRELNRLINNKPKNFSIQHTSFYSFTIFSNKFLLNSYSSSTI